MNWGSFGKVTFKSGFSPRTIKEVKDYSYKIHKPINKPLLYEFTGEDKKNLEITVILNRAFVKVEEALNTLEEYAKEASPQSLVIGKNYFGRYVIKRMEKIYEEILPNGEIFSVQLVLKLSKVPSSEVS